MSRWLVSAIETMTHEQLQRFANGCAALACAQGRDSDGSRWDNMEWCRQNVSKMPNVTAKADALFALDVLDNQAVENTMQANVRQQRRDFLRGG